MNSYREKLLTILTILVGLFAPVGPMLADVVLYASTGDTATNNGGRLYLINVTMQTATLIGSTGFGKLGGIAFNSSGVLYGVAGGSTGPTTLLTIDRGTAAATTIGTVKGFAVDGLRFDVMNTLYGSAFDSLSGSGHLLTIDPTTGTIDTEVGLVGSGNSLVVGLAFSADGALYGSRGASSGRTEDLNLIDLSNGHLTGIGSVAHRALRHCFWLRRRALWCLAIRRNFYDRLCHWQGDLTL